MDWLAVASSLVKLGIIGLVAGVGAYFGSYLKRKAEDRAIRENLTNLTVQVSAVTRATEEIKSEITSEVWDRQRQWEMKRDVIFDCIRALASVDDGLMLLANTHLLASNAPAKETSTWIDRKSEAMAKWSIAAEKFDAVRQLVPIACGDEVKDALTAVALIARKTASDILGGNNASYAASSSERMKAIVKAEQVARKELGVSPSGVVTSPKVGQE